MIAMKHTEVILGVFDNQKANFKRPQDDGLK